MAIRAACPACTKGCLLDDAPPNGVVHCPFCLARLEVPTQPASGSGWENGLRPGGEPYRPVTLEGERVAPIDRILPSKPIPFILIVTAIVVVFYLIGFVVAADKSKFLLIREWDAQPIYLAAHFVALRMFATVYMRNFRRGIAYLNMPRDVAERRMHTILGPVGGLVALLIAVPFCIRDYFYIFSDKYADSRTGVNGAVGVGDVVMWMSWCVEWLVNSYIWVLIAGFLGLTMWTLWRYHFRDRVEVVLHEKQYRPFLLMAGQGSTIIFFFGLITAGYIWSTGGDLSDYIGLGITLILLLFAFGPPWLLLRSQIDRVVGGEVFELRKRLLAISHRRNGAMPASGASSVLEVDTHVEEALLMLRIEYLDRLQRDLGQTEARAVLLKLLAPAGPILWQFLRPFIGF